MRLVICLVPQIVVEHQCRLLPHLRLFIAGLLPRRIVGQSAVRGKLKSYLVLVLDLLVPLLDLSLFLGEIGGRGESGQGSQGVLH